MIYFFFFLIFKFHCISFFLLLIFFINEIRPAAGIPEVGDTFGFKNFTFIYGIKSIVKTFFFFVFFLDLSSHTRNDLGLNNMKQPGVVWAKYKADIIPRESLL